jgi:hypothetical protein
VCRGLSGSNGQKPGRGVTWWDALKPEWQHAEKRRHCDRGSANLITTENGNKELEFAAVDKSHQQWNSAGENSIKSKLRFKKVKGPKTGGHFGRQSREDRKGRGGGSSSSGGTKDEVLDLGSGKESKAIGAQSEMMLVEEAAPSKSSLASSVHGGNIQGIDKFIRSRGRAGGGHFVWSSKVESFVGSFSGSKDGRSCGAEHSLRQGKPKFEGMAWNGGASVDSIGADGGAEGKVGNTGRAFGGWPKLSRKPKATWKTEEWMTQQTLSASRVALQALIGMWPAKAANNSAELQKAELQRAE